ncbi:MAG: BamA/TamA family outer membrane protein [Steroidobacteraceae bacterium]|nr:BamA/TamA family outer membrane protein [Steroidobacteraceae bacterium]
MMRARRAPGRRPGAWSIAALALAWMSSSIAADRIKIEIDGVEGNVAANVRGFLTLTRYAQRDDLTDAQVRRLADRAVDEAADALRPFGYYAPTVRSRTSWDDPQWIVRLRVKPGEPVMMESVHVQVSGPGRDEPALAAVAAASALQAGTQLDHAAYELLRADLLRTAAGLGYLDARLTRRELLVDPLRRKASATLELETGGQYRFGEITIAQDAIDDVLVMRFVRFRTGAVFSNDRIRSTQFALEDSNYFSEVRITAGRRDPEALTVPVTIEADPIKRDRYTVSFGYGTDTELRGRFAWDNRRVNTLGHRSRIELTGSAVLQEAIARYIIPVGDPALEKLEFSAGYISEELGDVDSERIEATAGLTQAMGQWQRVLFARLQNEKSSYPDGTRTEDLLLIPGVSYASMPPNFLTGWVRNAAYYVELSGSPETLGSDASYLRFYSRAERVWPISGPWYLRLRGEFGTSWVDEFSAVPASQRFFAGGDRSVRGFALDELSPPADPSTSPGADPSSSKGVGGEHKVVGSVEIERDLPRNFRIAAFYDTGNAFNDWSTPLEYSVGIGLRWRLPMLLIGLDVAQALSESDRRPRVHLNITQVL